MGIEQQEFEITQPGKRTIRATPTTAKNLIYVDVVRSTETGEVLRPLGYVAWQREICEAGQWCGYVNPAAFMPNGDEPYSVTMASVPPVIFNGDPETREPRMIATGDWDDYMAVVRGVASWCIGGQAPALGYIPHSWPIRGRGLRGALATMTNLVRRAVRW